MSAIVIYLRLHESCSQGDMKKIICFTQSKGKYLSLVSFAVT